MNNHYITWALATVILSLVVHISAVLAIPYLSENDAYKRLYAFTEVNQMKVVEKITPENQLWTFHPPDMKFAVCRYDLTKAPVQVDFVLLRGYWSVALYDDEGRNFYAADGFDLRRERSSLLLLGPDDIKTDEDALPISVPTMSGILVLRAPVDNQVMAPLVDKALSKAKCEQLRNAKRRIRPAEDS
ncbi:MAG: DUF1254 domain-containing protein [Rhodomicrobium sp.]|nr:MAG: DUF1254 domain-containing protein [Rhodomicrobium sp.]